MEDVITRSPVQLLAGLAAAQHVPLPAESVDAVVVAGMGGSWMAAQLVRDTGLAAVPLFIHRSYGLPGSLRGTSLVIASSYSGNTEETLSAYDAARSAGHPIVGIAAGGELERRCAADGVPFIRIPADPPTMQPRCATLYGVGILTETLARLSLTASDARERIRSLNGFLAASMAAARTRGEALAPAFTACTPVIYASDAYATVARIWKIKVNENAKTPAFWNVFPELNHNEFVGWASSRDPFHLLMLRDPEDHPRILQRMEITTALLRTIGVPATMVPIEGGTRLEKMFSTLLMGDWFSYRLALELGVDPSPVTMVEDLKKRLKDS